MKKKKKAPGKSHRKGIILLQLSELFPDEKSAVEWFEMVRWPDAVTGKEIGGPALPTMGGVIPTWSSRDVPCPTSPWQKA